MSEIRCRCGKLLSADGLGWVAQGYRVSRRSFDGTPIRGTVSRPVLTGPKLCRSCADETVARLRGSARQTLHGTDAA
jgi:hypothetical protein